MKIAKYKFLPYPEYVPGTVSGIYLLVNNKTRQTFVGQVTNLGRWLPRLYRGDRLPKCFAKTLENTIYYHIIYFYPTNKPRVDVSDITAHFKKKGLLIQKQQ